MSVSHWIREEFENFFNVLAAFVMVISLTVAAVAITDCHFVAVVRQRAWLEEPMVCYRCAWSVPGVRNNDPRLTETITECVCTPH